MAMTKAEQARMANLEQAVASARALAWPTYPMPEAMGREAIDAAKVPGGLKYGREQMVAFGWGANSRADPHSWVTRMCSDGINHGSGDTTSTQGMGHMYATEIEAWQAVRIEMTERFAAILAKVDAKIAAAPSR